MPRLPTIPCMISMLAAISNSAGMWSDPYGPRTISVTGFTLPVAMVYSSAPDVQAQVFDVLESQARSALLPDAVISAILNQLEVKITYGPMECQRVALSLADSVEDKKPKCIVISNTVTGICTYKMNAGAKCNDPTKATITPIPSKHTSFSGTLSTTNIIMSNWSKAMWQSVVDRAIRMLASGPFESHFFSASATVGGN
ncbi:hypothetical protein KIN20_003921 [Parelaphostrongylus tenuis]|uniref:Uncharacterized protein n=1 Tax=Parelaphostrongylus tenuis TaxID=148309 RepID=A0AAD5M2A8_PARTN|nr:hypothetical protein KIN20_003921 [Parelaphostrongylus tenuis]